VIVIAEGTCMVSVLANLAHFYANESCGQCTPCREGSLWLKKITSRAMHPNGTCGQPNDIDQMLSIANQVAGRTICAHGEALAWPVQSAQPKFREEYLQSLEARNRGERLGTSHPLI
jgi:NADH-quinone oxidoreductase subunit F